MRIIKAFLVNVFLILSFSCFLIAYADEEQCVANYQTIKLLLNEYKRPFTLLDIDMSKGHYSLKVAKEYDSVCVIANPQLDYEQLIKLCNGDRNLDRTILLKKLFTTMELQHLSECECFDVVLAMGILQNFGNDWRDAIDAMLNMSDHVIIEIPNQENSKEVENYIIEKGGYFFSSLDRSSLQHNTSLYLVSPGKKYLERKTWLLPKRKEKNYLIESSFSEKKLIKPIAWLPELTQTTDWVPGINLLTFKMCNGVHPTKETLKQIMTSLKDQPHTDWMANNMIVQGNQLVWIDTEDLGRGNESFVKPSFVSEERLKKHFELLDLENPQQIEHYFWYNLIHAPIEKRRLIKFFGNFLREYSSPLVFDIYTKDQLVDLYLGYGAKVVCFEVLDKLYQEINEKYKYESVVLTSKKTVEKYMGNSNLDAMIALYGLPTFCNIHASANEVYSILKGLSQPIPYLAFQFSNQDKEHFKKCVQYLFRLGYQQFNFSPREYPLFGMDTNVHLGTKERWVNAEELLEEIEKFSKLEPDYELFWGYIYAKKTIHIKHN